MSKEEKKKEGKKRKKKEVRSEEVHTELQFPAREPSRSIGFLFWHTASLWQRTINILLEPLQLTQAQFALMAHLGWLENKQEYITQAALARAAQTDIMMTSTILRSLEKRGLIQRSAHPIDSRAMIVCLSEQGKSLLQKALPIVEKADQDYFGKSEQLMSILTGLLAAHTKENRAGANQDLIP